MLQGPVAPGSYSTVSQLVGIDALYTTIGNGDFMNLYETNIMFIATDDNGQQI